MSDQVNVQQEKPDHHYRTEIPNIIFALGLSVQAIGVYAYLKNIAGDGGGCWKKQSVICEELGMAAATYIKYRDELQKPQELLSGKSPIHVNIRKKDDGSNDTTIIFIVGLWRDNGDYFRSKKKLCHSDSERGVIQNLNEGHSNIECKQEPFNKNQKQQTGLQPAAVVFSCFSTFSDLEIPTHEKEWMSQNFTEVHCKHAVDYVNHPSTIITTTVLKALKWACKAQPKINLKAIDRTQENKAYLKTIQDYQFIGLYKIQTSLNEIYFCRCEKTTLHAIYNTDERIFSVDSLTFKEDVKKHLEKIHSEKHIVREKR